MAPEKPKGRIKNQAVATTSEPIPEDDEKRLRAEIRRLELELKREKLLTDRNCSERMCTRSGVQKQSLCCRHLIRI